MRIFILTDLEEKHQSGFVNIIGRPNVGKSTLMNALLGEKMSVITNKPQTTRRRILGILSGEQFQIIFSDSPGIIQEPSYQLQKKMNAYYRSSFEDADILVYVTDDQEAFANEDQVIEKMKKYDKIPRYFILNKIDKLPDRRQNEIIDWWTSQIDFTEVCKISALEKKGTDVLLDKIKKHLPEGPAYFPKDQLSDMSERFFIGEIIRAHILELYHQELPYSSEVVCTEFKVEEKITRIRAEIYVERRSQKGIIIGKGGQAIKELGTLSRLEIEKFLDAKVFLELYVKVKDKWRQNDLELKRFGYH